MAPDRIAPDSRAPAAIERLVKQLNVAYKAVKLYPLTSAIPRETSEAAATTLHQILERLPTVTLQVTKDGLFHEDLPVYPDNAGFAAFAREFYSRNLAEVRFHTGCTQGDIVGFLAVLDTAPDVIAASGGFEAAMWEHGVSGITIAEAAARIVDLSPGEEDEEETEAEEGTGIAWPPTSTAIDAMLEGAVAGRPRDQRLLVRVLRDPQIVARYLRETATGRGTAPVESDLTTRIGALAHVVQFELPEDQAGLFRSIADAVLGLEPELRRDLTGVRLLDEARRDDAVATVIRQMSLDEVFETLLHNVEESEETRNGLTRAIRNLALINMSSSRREIVQKAGEAMRESGLSESFTASVVESVTPAKLTVHERPRTSDTAPVESILRLVELEPEREARQDGDEAYLALRAEASRGTTDGDVIAALVALVTIEHRAEQFASIMSLLEDSMGLLIDQQEFEVAANAAEGLLRVADDTEYLNDEQRMRARQAVETLGQPESMRKITAALRVYRADSAENAACRRLLSLLGDQTLPAMLEVLAAEPDMAARKAIIDLLAGIADRFIPELGMRLTDHRWYFVRNVVVILGTTRDPKVLGYLDRTLHHADARVRRETIRALAGVRDPRADQLLAAALSDEDEQNVQLAARYLGALKCRDAVPALIDVARGVGRGNRENAPRIEAIESLGRIGSPEALPVLTEFAKQRILLRGGRTRELRAAAESALRELKARGGGA